NQHISAFRHDVILNVKLSKQARFNWSIQLLKKKRISVIVCWMVLFFTVIPADAQDTIISIAVPQADESLYLNLIEAFEAQHPGIGVRLITNPFDFSEVSSGVEERLDDVLRQVR